MRLANILCGLAACTTMAFFAHRADGGQIAHYALSGDLNDSAGSNNGTFQGAGGANSSATFVADPMFGNVLDFDGSDDRISLGNVHTFQNNSWSISLWAKTPANADRVPLIGKNNGDNGFSAGERVYEITGNGTWGNIINPELPGNLAVNAHSHGGVVTNQAAPLDDGAWHMLTMVHDNSISAIHHDLYIDGVQQPVGGQTMNNNSNLDVGGFYLGFANASGSGAGGYLNGQMAEVSFFDHAISQGEVDDLFEPPPSDIQVGGGPGTIGMLNLDGTPINQTPQPLPGVQVVRVVKNGGFLSLRELEAIDSGGVNLALDSNGGVASASSEWNDGLGPHLIEVLNDGITDNSAQEGQAHTGNPPLAQEWMQVQLAAPSGIASVNIFNRSNCCADQSQNVTVEIYGDAAATNLIKSIPGLNPGPLPVGSDFSVDVGELAGGAALGRLSSGTTYFVELDAGAGASDSIKVPLVGTTTSSEIAAAGTLSLSVINGTPTVGQVFTILDADAISGSFSDVQVPALGGGLRILTDNLLVDGTVSIADNKEHVSGQGNIADEALDSVVSGDTLQGKDGVRVVRVMRVNPDFISLRELEAHDDNGVNVALAANGGVADGSSSWENPPGVFPHPISNLNNGETDTPHALGNEGHAHTGNNPVPGEWLQVTLDGQHTIDEVQLFNRGNCCDNQAQGLTLQLFGDEPATDLIAQVDNVNVPGPPGSAGHPIDLRTLRGGTAAAELDPSLVYHMEIDGDSLASDRLSIPLGNADNTALVVGGDLVVELAAGTLQRGDTFQLLDADFIFGAFGNVTLPGGSGLWDISGLTTNGTIEYVPEPVSLGLLGLGLLGCLGLIRRRRR